MAAGIPLSCAVSWLLRRQPPDHPPTGFIARDINSTVGPDTNSYAVAFVYAMLGVYLIDKALYELLYELDNRPTWVRIPLWGLL